MTIDVPCSPRAGRCIEAAWVGGLHVLRMGVFGNRNLVACLTRNRLVKLLMMYELPTDKQTFSLVLYVHPIQLDLVNMNIVKVKLHTVKVNLNAIKVKLHTVRAYSVCLSCRTG